jgi:cytochrome c-type biogenesis protein CcmH/NrfF
MRAAALVALVLALAAAGAALAAESRPTLADLEDEVMCPTCATPLDQSSSPVAQRMKDFISRRIAAGDSKQEIKDALVAEFGEQVLASPPARGFNLLAWVLPIAGLAVAALVLGFAAWRWTAGRDSAAAGSVDPRANGRAPVDPDLERRVDEELARFEA